MPSKGNECPYFTNGAWTTGPDIVMDLWQNDQDWDDACHALGFSVYQSYRLGEFHLNITVWRRPSPQYPGRGDESPHYLFELEASSGSSDHVYADSLPDVWRLLAQWLPVIRDSLVVDMLGEITSHEDDDHPSGAVEKFVRQMTQKLPGKKHTV